MRLSPESAARLSDDALFGDGPASGATAGAAVGRAVAGGDEDFDFDAALVAMHIPVPGSTSSHGNAGAHGSAGARGAGSGSAVF